MAGYIGTKAVNISTTGADINGNANVDGTLDVTGGDVSFYEDTGATVKFLWDASAEQLQLGTLNNTSNPAVLAIKSDANAHALSIEEPAGAGESWQIGVDVDGDLGFYNSTSTTVSVTFDDSGNVGIGTAAPQAVLDLGVGTGGRGLCWSNSASATYSNIWSSYSGARTTIGNGLKGSTSVSSGFESSVSSSWPKSAMSVGTGMVQFYTDNASTVAVGTAVTPAERMRIDSNGRVLINTTSARAPLVVGGAISSYRGINNGSAIATALARNIYHVMIASNYGSGNSVRSASYYVTTNNEGTAVANTTLSHNHNSQSASFSVSGGNLVVNGLPAGNNQCSVFHS